MTSEETQEIPSFPLSAGTVVDVAVVGAGIVGLASALELQRRTRASLLLLEAEGAPGMHQSGHNSGVLHSGLYYRPGSAKARHCATGRERLLHFCADHGIATRRCGKLVLATREAQLDALQRLQERGEANGLRGLRRLRADQLVEIEPHVSGVGGLWVPQTAVVDFRQLLSCFARLLQERGARIELDTRLISVRRSGSVLELATNRGSLRCRHLIACAGLQADRVARLCGLQPSVSVLPFRGEYYELLPERQQLVRNLIYPVPDPRFPFLGVHFTRRIDGAVEAGPNAVLALARHGYRWRDVSIGDLGEMARFPGSWRMAGRYWRTGLGEVRRSLSKTAFVSALREMLPQLQAGDLRRAGAGVRAMAVEPDGSLVDDFRIVRGDRMIHVLNAPSPAATASLSIGSTIADMAMREFGFELRPR